MTLDPIYSTDEYHREGCSLQIDVSNRGYGLRVYAPNGVLMESYALVKTPRAIGRMVEEWASGFAPRIHGRLDQASGSSVTEKISPNSTSTDNGVFSSAK